ncbi:MlaD family protein [Saccharothrix sp. ST-888]|uniref:MlaD family protein n=1 Tax=Saccharothrix sp. ST-888 TaxID=1427391 RepID=UPI0005ED3964|nr:MlaD family protein [Saccharothrix sp. ST-888]KJK58477.1 ABC transporter substrate-binding protein [Saccharothrix sp. ST-888]
MLTLATRLKNLAFLLIAVLVLGFIAVRYADLGRYAGLRGYYSVQVRLAQTGGLFEHANVTYRGVSVGRVGPIRLTPDGVEAELRISDSAPRIPARLQAVVADLSAVGEQYIDLRPSSDAGPYLENGSIVARQDTSTPAPVTNLLTSLDTLTTSVPLQSLRTVVDELGKTFAGQGANLQTLLDNSNSFLKAADQALPGNTVLINDGRTVLHTQADEADAIRSFADGASQLAAQLGKSDTDLRRVIANAPLAAGQVTALVKDLDPSLSVVLANLLTTSDLAVTRQHGIEELLVRLPQVAAAGATAVDDGGAHVGMALTFFSPLPCTAGYGGTGYRNGLDTGTGPALNTAARCTSPPGTGIDVRGSANAPTGGVPTPARPGTAAAAGTAGTGGSDRTPAAALPGALALPALPGAAPNGLAGLLGLEDTAR